MESNSAFTAWVARTIFGASSSTSSGSLRSQSAYSDSASTGWRMSCAALARKRFFMATADTAACRCCVSDLIRMWLWNSSSRLLRAVSWMLRPARSSRNQCSAGSSGMR
ncbi:hypothetical protein D3C71_515380 [compost metagenome]